MAAVRLEYSTKIGKSRRANSHRQPHAISRAAVCDSSTRNGAGARATGIRVVGCNAPRATPQQPAALSALRLLCRPSAPVTCRAPALQAAGLRRRRFWCSQGAPP